LDATGVREGVSVSNRNRKYSPEFRAEAVRLYRSVKGEKSMRELAVELGVSNETLRSWIKQADSQRRQGRRQLRQQTHLR
jgi:transposase